MPIYFSMVKSDVTRRKVQNTTQTFLFRCVNKYSCFVIRMIMFSDGVECEFREPHVRLTFREAVQLFEHRAQFIKRSSNACLVRVLLSTMPFSFFLVAKITKCHIYIKWAGTRERSGRVTKENGTENGIK